MEVTVKASDGRVVLMTPKQATVIEVLSKARKGGCASVAGYKPSSKWIKQPVYNIQMLTNFSTEKLYQRRLDALEQIDFKNVVDSLLKDEKLKTLSLSELRTLFFERKIKLMESLVSTLTGEEKNAHQEAHDRCYAYVEGVKIHLVTTTVDKIKQPVMQDGKVVCDSIMVPYLELKTTVIEEGERKKVNSGLPVLMGNAIEHFLNNKCVQYKTLSLREDNFEAFRIDKKEIFPDNVASLQLLEE